MMRKAASMLLITTLLFLAMPAYGATDLEKGVVEEMNLARTKPRQYAEHLVKLRKQYRGVHLYREGLRIKTQEGGKAVDEAIAFLRKQKPLPPLTFSEGLAAAAAELANEQKEGGTGHAGESGDMKSRIERRGEWSGSIGENLSYGFEAPRDVVMQLIVDDGVPGRGHRKNIFNPAFREAGVACGTHPTFRTVCVTDFAGKFTGK